MPSFFFCHERRHWSEEEKACNLVNPWAEKHRPSWEDNWKNTAGHEQQQLQRLAREGLGLHRFLGIWIPLRRNSDAQPEVIHNHYPGESFDAIFGGRWAQRLVEFAPLLRHVRTISARRLMPDGSCEEILNISPRAKAACQFVRLKNGPLHGELELRHGQDAPQCVHFHGVESLGMAELTQLFQGSDNWPRQAAFDKTTDQPERATPHGAVVFTRRPAPNGGGRVQVQHAVFLPLGGGEQHPLPGKWDYSVFLHGFYFVNSSRRQIESFDPQSDQRQDALTGLSEAELRRAWNCRLTAELICPGFVPALAGFVDHVKATGDEVSGLVRALAKSEVLTSYKPWLYARHQFLFRLDQNGGAWKAESAEMSVYVIPAPKFPFQQLLTAFPSLQRIAIEQVVTLKGKALLSSKQPPRLPDDLLAELFAGVPVTVFDHNDECSYLLDLIPEDAATHASDSPLTQALVRLANKLVVHQLPEDQKRRALWEKFFERLPAKAFIRLTCASTAVEQKVAKTLKDPSFPVALLWQDFRDADGKGSILWPSLLSVLQRLGGLALAAETAIKQRSDITIRLLKACELRPENWADLIADLPLFHACESGGRGFAASIADLRMAHAEQRLFTGGELWAADVAKAAPILKPLLVTETVTDILDLTTSDCGAAACVRLLRNASRLAADFASRKPMFERLLGHVTRGTADVWAALRCLLHGQVSQWEQTAPLLREDNDQKVFVSLARGALVAAGQLWRLIAAHIADQLALDAEQEVRLSLLNTSASHVEALVREVGPEKVDCTDLSREDCDILLRQFNDVAVLRGLNIHEGIAPGAGRVRIEGHTYVDDGRFEGLPPEFDHLVTRIRLNTGYARFTSPQLVPMLGWEAVIRIALEQPNPESYCHTILTAIWKHDPLPTGLKAVVFDSRWLMMADDMAGAPSALLHVPGAEAELDQLPPDVLAGRVPLQRLDQAVRAHDRFETFKDRVLPSVEDALKAVASLLQPHTAYSTGLSGEWSLDDTRDWVHTLGDVPAGTLPLAVLVKAFYESNQVRDFVPAFLSELGGTISNAAYAAILKHLAAGYEAAGAEKRAPFNRVIVRYLRAIAEQGPGFARTVLKSNAVKLLTAQGEWKSPAQMAFRTNGICEADTLCDEQAAALELVRPQPQAQAAQTVPVAGAVQPAQQSCAAVLQGYFANWAGVPRPLIGVFIGMLGGDRNVQQLAQSFLGVHDLATLREVLCSFDGHLAVLANEIGRHHFRCSIVTSDRIHWWSVIGTMFEARRGGTLTSLLVGTGPDAFVRTGNPFEISFRLVELEGNPAATGVQTLQQLLQETTKQVLTFVYCRRNFPLDQVSKQFAQTSQLHILIAQQFLLRNAIALLRQAGAGSSDHLKPILKRWDEANNRRAEERLSPKLPRRAQRLEDEAIDALSQAFEDDQVHAEVLRAVRKTVERFQYDERSVAFELWQNADDAYVQLERLCSPQPDGRPASFVIVQNGSTLAFLHWGRPINQFRGETGFNGQDVGFDRDLQNMLTLNLSDKDSESGPAVTGKFGLGFKSVLLVSDAPKVLSGEVDFVIRGGLYPKPLTPNDRSRLEHYITEHTSDRTTAGTVFELQLAPCQSPKPVLGQFLELVPVLLAFSRRIKRVVMSGRDEPSSCWSESALQGHEGISFGLLASPIAGADRALLLRGEQTTLLLGMNALGFIPLPESVPVFWVTAPTRDTLGYGFAVNGPFEPDAGRVQLAGDSEKNRCLANELSRVIAERLKSLWDMARRDWDALRQQLGLSPGVEPNTFWGSLWHLIGVRFAGKCPRNDTTDVADLARAILWKSDATGLRDFYTHRAALPTGLWGDYSTLTQLRALRFRAAGVLDDEHVFSCIVEWPRFKQRFPVGAICSNGNVGRHLAALGAALQQCEEIHLCEVVEWELGTEMLVDPAKAAQLGVLITPEFKKRLTKGGPAERAEAESLAELLRAVQFQAADGSWHRSGELLVVQPSEISEDGGDEAKRAAFAPAEHRLHPAYTEKGLEFFLAARGRIANPSPEEMAKWALTASTSKQRKAVLQYLLAGSEATRHLLARQLRNMRTDENWLSQLDDADTEAAGLNAEEQSELSCFVLRTRKPEDGSPLVVPPVPTTPRPEWTPAQLWKWWGEGKRSAAHEYILKGDNWQLLYPSTEEPDEARRKHALRKDLLDADSEQGRRTWYRLFGVACLMSEVRRTSEMREFWRSELEGKEAFWEVTSKPMFGDGADKVFDGLFRREFAHVHARYERAYFWRRVFYDIRKIHRLVWDSGFPAIILARAETVNSGRELIEFLRSGHIPNQEKWVGVVGQSIGAPLFFVIRELRRLGVIKNAAVNSAAFFPCRPVRRAAASIGWLSDDDVQAWEIGHLATISETLHRRISGDAQYVSKLLSDYDIPLLHMGVACRPLPPPLPVL